MVSSNPNTPEDFSQASIINSLPEHLQPFAAVQDYSRYSPRDQAAWRFLLHQLQINLRGCAHETYFEGLARTGISLEYIPRIEEMNAHLSAIGWRAVVVDGFLPPAIFMEFQAHRVLAIAVAMRRFEHMLYTPAPDIVHEAAGHAPFLIDVDYAEFLQRFGELGQQAVASAADNELYEAIRQLSIIKEDSNASQQQVATAEDKFHRAKNTVIAPSEAALLSRLHWWTVEYGLVGDLNQYKMFGAGLLSSLGECTHCRDDSQVRKVPLTLQAVVTSYDITEEQPQLFVTQNCRHLTQVLEQFGRQMCVNKGGASSVKKAIDAGTVNSVVLNSGLEISARFNRAITDAVGNVVYLSTEGPTQLAYQRRQLPGHGINYHSAGFGSPVGRLQAMERCLSTYTIDELKHHEIEVGRRLTLKFLSGIQVAGVLKRITRRQQKNLIFSFEDCDVRTVDGERLFSPEWGIYDMAVGDEVISVFGGSSDQLEFPVYLAPSRAIAAPEHAGEGVAALMSIYRRVRLVRNNEADEDPLDLLDAVLGQSEVDWLLLYEALELAQLRGRGGQQVEFARAKLLQLDNGGDSQTNELIAFAKARLHI